MTGSSPERSRESAARRGLDGASDRFEAVLESDIYVVHICTPDDIHAENALAALNEGEHVICENGSAAD